MAKHTIKIRKYADVIEEYTSTAVEITPGYLLEVTSAGLVQAHSSNTGRALAMFAIEDELQGRGIDVNYAASTKVQCWLPGHGDMVYAFLADGQNAVIGNWLASNGAGKLIVSTTNPIGQAVEAVDMSGSAGVDPSGRIIVRID
jgi:hypothetical protein